MTKQSKVDAIYVLFIDTKNLKPSTASARRVVKALHTLGLFEAERIRVLHYMDYCNEDGTPWTDHVKKVW